MEVAGAMMCHKGLFATPLRVSPAGRQPWVSVPFGDYYPGLKRVALPKAPSYIDPCPVTDSKYKDPVFTPQPERIFRTPGRAG